MGVRGARLILVEDEALLALDLQDMLEDMGCLVVGTAGRLDEALLLAETDFDLALLDMNLAGARIDPVAGRIAARGKPIIFVTGYGQRTLPPGIVAPVIDKPYSLETLGPIVGAILEAHRA